MTQTELLDTIRAEIERLKIKACGSQATEEEIVAALSSLDLVIRFLDTLNSFADELMPSIPSDLDEAAGEYLDGHKPLSRYNWGDLMDAFKAGAEWMAGQGVTSTNVSIDELPVELYQKCVEVGMTSEDKVIVQIRKI